MFYGLSATVERDGRFGRDDSSSLTHPLRAEGCHTQPCARDQLACAASLFIVLRGRS
jgi:hypothetical protein